jgi:hypothetical protein
VGAYWRHRHPATSPSARRGVRPTLSEAPTALIDEADATELTLVGRVAAADAAAATAELVLTGAEVAALRRRLPADLFQRVRHRRRWPNRPA